METGNGVINWSGLHGKTANHSPYLSLLPSSLLQHIGNCKEAWGTQVDVLLSKSLTLYHSMHYVRTYVLWTVGS